MVFEHRLKKLIEAAGLLPAHLAAKIGVSSGMVSHWLSGHRRPSLNSLCAISKALNISADLLIFGSERIVEACGSLAGVLANPSKSWLAGTVAEACAWSQAEPDPGETVWRKRLLELDGAIYSVRSAPHNLVPAASRAAPGALVGALQGADQLVRPKGQTARASALAAGLVMPGKKEKPGQA
jgi:transcriptional regulator with XRE-family HTH domain